MPFGLWTRLGRRNQKFNGIRQVVPMCPDERAHWRHLANAIKLSISGSDAALCHITLTTCLTPVKERWRCASGQVTVGLVSQHRLGHCGTNELSELRQRVVLHRTLFRSLVPITFTTSPIVIFLKESNKVLVQLHNILGTQQRAIFLKFSTNCFWKWKKREKREGNYKVKASGQTALATC